MRASLPVWGGGWRFSGVFFFLRKGFSFFGRSALFADSSRVLKIRSAFCGFVPLFADSFREFENRFRNLRFVSAFCGLLPRFADCSRIKRNAPALSGLLPH